MQLNEQYRPTSYSDVVGQDKALAKINGLRKRGLSGRAFWISGQSGTGKTTIARILASEIADPINIVELKAVTMTPTDVEDMEREFRYTSLGVKSGKVFIINESHTMRKPVIQAMLDTLERIPSHVMIIFTCIIEGQQSLFEDFDDANPMLSRCIRLDLARRGLCEPFAERAQMIARREGLDGKPLDSYIRLMKDVGNNLRAALSAIEAGQMMD